MVFGLLLNTIVQLEGLKLVRDVALDKTKQPRKRMPAKKPLTNNGIQGILKDFQVKRGLI